MGDRNAAQECYERTLSFVTDASDMHSIYLRLAFIYLHNKEVEQQDLFSDLLNELLPEKI